MTKFVSISRDPTSSWSQPGRLVFHPGYIWYFITLYCFLNKSYLQNRPSFRKFQSLYKQLTYSKPCSLLRTYLLFQNMATRWSCVHLFHTFPRKAERFLSLETIFKCCESFHMSCSRFMKLWNYEIGNWWWLCSTPADIKNTLFKHLHWLSFGVLKWVLLIYYHDLEFLWFFCNIGTCSVFKPWQAPSQRRPWSIIYLWMFVSRIPRVKVKKDLGHYLTVCLSILSNEVVSLVTVCIGSPDIEVG